MARQAADGILATSDLSSLDSRQEAELRRQVREQVRPQPGNPPRVNDLKAAFRLLRDYGVRPGLDTFLLLKAIDYLDILASDAGFDGLLDAYRAAL